MQSLETTKIEIVLPISDETVKNFGRNAWKYLGFVFLPLGILCFVTFLSMVSSPLLYPKDLSAGVFILGGAWTILGILFFPYSFSFKKKDQ